MVHRMCPTSAKSVTWESKDVEKRTHVSSCITQLYTGSF